MDGKLIAMVDSVKFLGVQIDKKLNWKSHIDQVCSKLARMKGLLIHIRNKVNLNTAKLLYNSFFVPHLSYCCEVWGHAYKTNLKRIITLQKQAIRVVCKTHFLEHSMPFFKATRSLIFEDIVRVRTLRVVFQAVQNSLPSVLNKYFAIRNDHYPHRKVLQLRQSNCKLTLKRQTLVWSGIELWNNLDAQLKSKKSLTSFVKTLKNIYIDK